MKGGRDKDNGWKEFMRRAKQKLGHVKVGILDAGEGAETHEGGDLTNAQIASIHEFGAPGAGIPERSFIRATFDAKRHDLQHKAEHLMGELIFGHETARGALGKLGAMLAAEIKKTVTQGPGVPPPLQQATINRKGSTRPLVDTGQMIGAVTWKVWVGEK